MKTDFSKWVDEDEQEGAAIDETEDMDPMGGMGGPPGMGGMGGMPGMGGMGGGMPGGMDFAKVSLHTRSFCWAISNNFSADDGADGWNGRRRRRHA